MDTFLGAPLPASNPARARGLALCATALLILPTATGPSHAARPKAAGCTAGRFVVTEGHDLLGGAAIPTVLSLQGGTVTIEGPCPATGRTKKLQRTGTPITARWKQCGERRRVRLTAKAADCSALRGTVRAGKRRAKFTAVRIASLACEAEGYPCAWSDVGGDDAARSLALSEESVVQMEAGQTAEQVGAFLASQADMADVTVDGPIIGFRLAGGRPMIVDFTDEQQMLPRAETTTSAAASGSGFSKRASTGPVTNAVVGSAGSSKGGLVLSPFRYEPGFGAGETVAAALDDVRGYEGNVTYLATTDELDPQVTVDTLTRLEDYDVIHIDTHGGTLCKKKETAGIAANATKGEGKEKCEGGVTDFLVQRFHGTADDLRSLQHPGVVHYRGRVHQSIAITADFFRHYYPRGLSDAVFILAACNTFRTDMAEAIAGEDGVFISWDRYTDLDLVRGAGVALLDSLGRGVTVGTAMAQLPPLTPGNPEAAGSRLLATARRSGGDLRIRELPIVLDGSGSPLDSTSTLEILGRAEDGLPDSVLLPIAIDGASAADADGYLVRVAVGGTVVIEEPLAQLASPTGPYAWLSEREVPLGEDVQHGQMVDIAVSVDLPEGGTSVFAASPSLSGPTQGFSPGRVWDGSFQLIYYTEGARVQLNVQARFERDPEQGPDTDYPTYLMVGGTMEWSLANNDLEGCNFQAPVTTTTLGPDRFSNFMFDLTKDPVEFRGFGSSDGPLVDLVATCPELDPVTTKTEAGGVWFVALGSQHHTVTGTPFSGIYDDGAQRPAISQWTMTKVE